jgi:antitoxin (DNA-binding transcriptional repressor) of toxin-antitoxin stability system
MKSITLRELVRETRKIKRITDSGASFLVTDHGKPLWKISPAIRHDDDTRNNEIDAELDSLLAEKKSDVSLSDIVTQSRR